MVSFCEGKFARCIVIFPFIMSLGSIVRKIPQVVKQTRGVFYLRLNFAKKDKSKKALAGSQGDISSRQGHSGMLVDARGLQKRRLAKKNCGPIDGRAIRALQ
jgi:hypothetical protein